MTRARDLADSADKDIAGTLTLDGLTVDGDALFTTGTAITLLSRDLNTIQWDDGVGSPNGVINASISSDTSPALIFSTRISGSSPTERMRIDNSGNLLVGTTDTNLSNNTGTDTGFGVISGELQVARDGGVAMFNRTSTDGDIVSLRKDGTTVGSIRSNSGARIAINSEGSFGLLQSSNTNCFFWSALSFSPFNDNVRDLGEAGFRYDDVYATNGTIQTSDRNEKQDIAELSDAEQRVAVAAKGLLRKFRWRDAVEEKGDEARTHFGIIAQDLQAAFADEGLDAGDYAMFIHSTWTDEETGEERSRMGVRYSELLAFIIAAI